MPCTHNWLYHQTFGFRPECTITQSDTPPPLPLQEVIDPTQPEVIDLTLPEDIDLTPPEVINLTLILSTPASSSSTGSI